MSMPKVSIMIVTYNQVDFIHETLKSAIEQDYENLEVVVADDGSKDGTSDIIKDYAKRNPSRVKAVMDGTNLGITKNCNRALRQCTGELIAIQGGDDVFLPGKITRQVEWFSQSEKHVLCYHDAEVFESSSNEKICNYSEIAPLISGIGPAALIERMRLGAATTVMVRKSSIPEYGFDVRLPMVSDWKFQIDCLMGGGEYGFLDGVYARYRRHGGNSRLKASKQYYADCLMTTYLVEKEYTQYALACRKARARIYGGMAMDMAARNNYRSAFQMYVKSVRESYSWKLLPGIIFILLPEALRKLLIKLLGKSIPELTYSQH
jgi:glycosyltransferase involved in cell wall biosynthesis